MVLSPYDPRLRRTVDILASINEETITGDVPVRYDQFNAQWPNRAYCTSLIYYEVPEVPMKLCPFCFNDHKEKIFNYTIGFVHKNVIGYDFCPLRCDLCNRALVKYDAIDSCSKCRFSLATCFRLMSREEFLEYLSNPVDASKTFCDIRVPRVHSD